MDVVPKDVGPLVVRAADADVPTQSRDKGTAGRWMVVRTEDDRDSESDSPECVESCADLDRGSSGDRKNLMRNSGLIDLDSSIKLFEAASLETRSVTVGIVESRE